MGLVGRTLRHFRIVDKLGEGGMGAVYLALDTKLGREVAIKVLPEKLVSDRERLARFEREARVLAALDHPHIGSLYEVGEVDGLHFLVLQLAPGETLAERLERGPVGIDEAVELGLEIAAALEAAHDKGIVHRDLKPANVKVDADGHVKVLDFGLASAVEPEDDASAVDAETLTARLTRVGTLLGTVTYMAPEQASGEHADRRADIWAFGVLLYELLTGHAPFARATTSGTLEAVLSASPEWSGLPAGTPPALRRLLRRCLTRDRRHRLQHIGDARIVLQEIATGERDRETPESAPAAARTWWIPAAALAGLVVGILSTSLLGGRAVTPPRPGSTWEVRFESDRRLDVGGRIDPIAISPDGRHLAYVVDDRSDTRLYLRSFDRIEPSVVQGSDGARNPFFSPDSRWVGFFAREGLYKVPVTGGVPLRLCDAPLDNLGASWGPNGELVFASYASGLWRVSEDGGEPEWLTPPSAGGSGGLQHRWPQFLPDGRRILLVRQGVEGPRVAIYDLETRATRLVAGAQQAAKARYLSGGYLLLAEAGELFGARFDSDREQVIGAPVRLVSDVLVIAQLGAAYFSVSDGGTLAYVPGAAGGGAVLEWVDRQGRAEPLVDEPGAYNLPRLAPDGRRLAVTQGSEVGGRQLLVLDLERGTRTAVTSEGRNGNAVWSPDGERLVYSGDRGGNWDLYSVSVDGGEEPVELVVRPHEQWMGHWTSDERLLVYYEIHPETARDIWTVGPEGEHRPWLATPANERGHTLSPDDRWIAYVSNESGRDEVYVCSFPECRGRRIVSSGGGKEPAWAPDGTRLYYRQGIEFLEVPVDTSSGLDVGLPRVMFEGPYDEEVAGNANYDVALDGERFVVVRRDLGAADRVRVVLDWASEIEELLGRPES